MITFMLLVCLLIVFIFALPWFVFILVDIGVFCILIWCIVTACSGKKKK